MRDDGLGDPPGEEGGSPSCVRDGLRRLPTVAVEDDDGLRARELLTMDEADDDDDGSSERKEALRTSGGGGGAGGCAFDVAVSSAADVDTATAEAPAMLKGLVRRAVRPR